MATDFKPAKAAYARSRPTGAISLWAYRHPTRNPRASAAAIRPMTPSDSPKAENRRGSSVPKKPAPSMISAVLIKGGITRQGMAAAGWGSDADGAEFMEDVIADFAAGYRDSRAQGRFCHRGRCPLGLRDDAT